MKKSYLLFLLALVVAGCQNNSSVATNQPGSSSGGNPATTGSDSYDPGAASTQPTAGSQPAPPAGTPNATAAPGHTDVPGKGKAKGDVTIPLKGLPPEIQAQVNQIKKQQDQAFIIPPVGTKDWVHFTKMPDAEAAKQIAALVEQTLAGIKDTSGEVQVAYQTADPGGPSTGSFTQDLKIKNSSEFRIPFITVGDAPLACQVVANGKVKLVQYGPEWKDKQPVSAPTKTYTPDAAPAPNWERDFTQMVFEPITHSKYSWPETVKQWLSGDEGYHLEVDYRDLPFVAKDPKTGMDRTYHYKDYRFKVTRSDEAATMYGKSDIEVVIDAYKWLPKTIRSVYTNQAGTKTWKITWTCSYKFHQSLTDSDFKAPYTNKLKA